MQFADSVFRRISEGIGYMKRYAPSGAEKSCGMSVESDIPQFVYAEKQKRRELWAICWKNSENRENDGLVYSLFIQRTQFFHKIGLQ